VHGESRGSQEGAEGMAPGKDIRGGIDIGGTKAVAVLARADGEILAERRIDQWTGGSWEADLDKLAGALESLLEETGASPSEISALGVSAAGPLDPIEGVVLNPPNLPGWRQVPIRAVLEERLGVPVRVENDANAAALAEWRFGAGRGAQNLAYLTMSTGIGGGLILDGRLYRGARFQAGEVGHMPVVPDGRQCACGLRGCLEAYVGGAALATRMREELAGEENSVILNLAGGDPAAISAETWVEAIRAGDRYALRLREEYLDHLAQGLAILVMTLDLERIVLGTIVRSNPELLLEPLKKRLKSLVWAPQREVDLRGGELGPRMPAYAALCVAELDDS
jgi:glucokinase